MPETSPNPAPDRLQISMRPLAAIFVVLISFTGPALAAPSGDLVQAKLLADVSTVKLGEPFTVGVLLRMAPHYHVYWLNPGDSGQATSIELKAFPNSAVKLHEMPTPFRIELPGGLVNYGYENEVMFLATVSPGVNPKMDTDKLELTADVSWLVCNDQECIPGGTKLSLSLPISGTATPDNGELFDRWRTQIPSVSMTDSQIHAPPTNLNIGFKIPDAGERSFKQIQWFPANNDPLIFTDIKVAATGDGAQVTARMELPAGQKLTRNKIDSVLGYTDEKGVRREIRLIAPIQPAPPNEQSSTVDKGK